MCALIGCHCTKAYTKCAKLVDEKNNRLFCCLRVLDFKPKILIKVVHLTKKGDIFLMKKVIHSVILKKEKKYMSMYYFCLYSI